MLLIKQLKTFQSQGRLDRAEGRAKGRVIYLRTNAAIEHEPIITALGKWACRNTSFQDCTRILVPNTFVWNLRLSIDAGSCTHRYGKANKRRGGCSLGSSRLAKQAANFLGAAYDNCLGYDRAETD